MSETITIDEINKNIRDLGKYIRDIKKSNKNADYVIERMRHERERVRTGFLDGETPRLMALLTEGIETLEYLKDEAKAYIKKFKRVLIKFKYERREVIRLTKEREKLEEEKKRLETPTTKPIPVIEKESPRQKRKKMQARRR